MALPCMDRRKSYQIGLVMVGSCFMIFQIFPGKKRIVQSENQAWAKKANKYFSIEDETGVSREKKCKFGIEITLEIPGFEPRLWVQVSDQNILTPKLTCTFQSETCQFEN